MKKHVLILLTILPTLLWAQSSLDSVLMNERTMDRPITLHSHQLRLTGNYQLGISNKRYDENSNVIDLAKDGITSMSNGVFFEVKYGLNDFLQLTAAIGTESTVERKRTTNLILTDEPSVEINSITINKGWTDVFLAMDFRAPFKTKKIDWLVSAGGSLPSANAGQSQPTHSVSAQQGYNVINYQFHRSLGNGVPVLYLGTLLKYRFTNTAISINALYEKAIGESRANVWNYQLNGNVFDYQRTPYQFFCADRLYVSAEVEQQLYPWFDVLASLSYLTSTGGWSTESGTKMTNPDATYISFNPGFEILITHKIWLRQRVMFPVTGANQLATLQFSTTMNYNLFPFHR